MMNFIVTI